MSDNTGIEWTDRTWNPTIGCTRVSPGCDNCYAMRLAHRFDGHTSAYAGTTAETGVDWSGKLNLLGYRLDEPFHWRKPQRVFVNSMSDLFHDQVPDEFIAEVFAVMALAPRHTFQVLTKRHGRMRSLLDDPDFRQQVSFEIAGWTQAGHSDDHLAYAMPDWWPLRNVWLGVSAEDQKWADIRIPALLETPAAVRWVSAEPLLGPINLEMVAGTTLGWNVLDAESLAHPALNWVVAGGESGPGARPLAPQWVRDIRDQCGTAGVPFLFKQWGAWAPTGARGLGRPLDERRIYVGPADGHGLGEEIARVSKHVAGRHLDGQLHDEYPRAVA